MSHRAPVLLFVACLALPGQVVAQAIGLGARVGTLGAGGEAAVELNERLVARGGVGYLRYEPDATFDGVPVTLDLPPTWYNAGVDLYLNGAMRIGAGWLFKSDDTTLRGTFDQSYNFGGIDFTPAEIGTLTGVIDSQDSGPYLLLGFGKHTAPGFGLFIDFGVAFLGEPDVRLDSEGGTLSDDPATRDALDQAAQDWEDDMRAYLRFWPILNVGLRIGLG